ncbi:MAG: J domain-containing protein [Terracidiphilus sp.]
MPCACEQCVEHAKTLGVAQRPANKAAIRKAYRAAAKLWHPDRFENDPGKRQEAEEHFKQIQIAYRELFEHFENPKEWPVEPAFAPAAKVRDAPSISFGGAPGCFVAPDFSLLAGQIIAAHVREPDRALAIVDLSGPGAPAGQLAQYILLTCHGIFVRDAHQIVSLLWYAHLGEIKLVDKRKNGKLGLRHRIVEKLSGTEQKYSLEIDRHDGTHFFSIAGQVDDSVKKVLYNFLEQRKAQPPV